MKTRILSFSDSNMPVFVRWNFYLDDEDCGAYRLSCHRSLQDDEAMVMEPVLRLAAARCL